MAIVLAALARTCAARGLKTQRSPGAFEALSKLRVAHEDLQALEAPETAAPANKAKLQAENKDLIRRNTKLEGLLQMARAKVQKAKVIAEKQSQIPGGSPEVLKQEIEDLKIKVEAEEIDKKALVQTLRQMLARNTTQAFQKQAERDRVKISNLASKCGEERHELQAQSKEATEKIEEMKELSQSLQGQNLDLKKELVGVRAALAKAVSKTKELSVDKANLLATMNGMMRESAKAKAALQNEEHIERTEAEELRNDTAVIANLTHEGTRPTATKNAPRKTKQMTRKLQKVPVTLVHHKHEESMAAQLAHMKDIDRYLDSVYTARVDRDGVSGQPPVAAASLGKRWQQATLAASNVSDWKNVGTQVDILQTQDALLKTGERAEGSQDRKEHGNNLTNWLGFHSQPNVPDKFSKNKDGLSPIDALEPEAVKQKKQVGAQQEKLDADDGGDGIQDLLAQANEQIAVMDGSGSA